MNDLNLGIWATRIYVVALILSIAILTLYSSIISNTRLITVSKPSIQTFEALHQAFADTLSCPCSQLAIPYSQVIIASAPKYHQVRPELSRIGLVSISSHPSMSIYFSASTVARHPTLPDSLREFATNESSYRAGTFDFKESIIETRCIRKLQLLQIDSSSEVIAIEKLPLLAPPSFHRFVQVSS